MKQLRFDVRELVARAQRGDLDAFGQIVHRFQDMAVGYAYSILGDFHLAEDAAQEAFIGCFTELRQLREPDAFPSWFRRIVFTQCNRLTRGKRVPVVSLEAAEHVADVHDPVQAIERKQLSDRILDAVGALPEDERAVMTLFCINGYSQAEVGAFLDVPVTTVKNRLHSARTKLREGMMEMVEETLRGSAPGDEFAVKIKGRIDRLEWVSRWLTSLGCLEGCTNYLGYSYPDGWVAGATGDAFAIRIHREICPAGIIAWKPPTELGLNIGVDREIILPQMDDVSEQQQIVWTATEEALRSGSPCIGFAMEQWQSYLIYGYDDDGYYYRPVMEGDGYFPKAKMGVEVPCVMTIVRKAEPADDLTTVRDALDFAVKYNAAPEEVAPGFFGEPGEFQAGVEAYDFWAESLREGRADAHGNGYNAHTYAELRQLAVKFLEEASRRVKASGFDEAITHYRTVADHLRTVADLFPMPAIPEHVKDKDRIARAVGALSAAKSAETLGLQALEQILREMQVDHGSGSPL